MESTDKLAVLIDADNAQPSIVDSLLSATTLFDLEERQIGDTKSKAVYVRDKRKK